MFLGALALFLFMAGITAAATVGRESGEGKGIGNTAFLVTEPKADKITKNLKEKNVRLSPGQTLVKDPTVTLKKGSSPSYLRARLVYGGLNGARREELEKLLAVTEGWVKNPGDGYFYYQYPVEAEESVCFFRSITIPKSWGRSLEELRFCLEADVEAAEAGKVELLKNKEQTIVGWHKNF